VGPGFGGLLLSGHCRNRSESVIISYRLSVPNNLAMNSAGDAVLKLQIHLGDRVFGIDRGIGDIT